MALRLQAEIKPRAKQHRAGMSATGEVGAVPGIQGRLPVGHTHPGSHGVSSCWKWTMSPNMVMKAVPQIQSDFFLLFWICGSFPPIERARWSLEA